MPVFEWTAKDASGRQRNGVLKGKNMIDVSKRLEAMGLKNVSIRQKANKSSGLFKGVKIRDLAIFSRQFSVMIEAGIPIVQALEILAEQTENKFFSSVIVAVKTDVEGGKTLAESMEKYPKAFPNLLIQMAAVGETGGALADTLKEVAQYYEKMDALRRRIIAALAYPSIVFMITILITAGLLIFIVPRFAKIYSDVGAALPGPTQFVVNLSHLIVHNIIWFTIGTVVFLVAFKKFIDTEKGRAVWDSSTLKMPVVGPLLRKTAISRFSRTLGILLTSGVPILESLDITSKASGNYVIAQAVLAAKKRIGEGKTIGEPLRETGVFPPLVVHLITVGEQTGRLSEMLGRIADFYEDEVDSAVETLASTIEPIMILFIGIIVGGLLIALYLPIFKLGTTIK